MTHPRSGRRGDGHNAVVCRALRTNPSLGGPLRQPRPRDTGDGTEERILEVLRLLVDIAKKRSA